MARRKAFQTVLTEAVADLRKYGFDSKARLQRWVRELRRAADRQTGDEASLEHELKRALKKIYTKQVTHGALSRAHGIPAYTVKKLSPTLQRELSRRILAATDLITLNRHRSVEQTLQRFSGWATAQTPGSVSPEKIRAIKADIAKSIRQQPFEKRRVIIDQTAKLNSNLNYLTATNNKAIAVEWDANARRPHYNHRKEHLARDGKVFVLKEGWAYQEGFITKGAALYEEVDGFGVAPFCQCRGRYLYHLDQLPDELLSTKARTALEKHSKR